MTTPDWYKAPESAPGLPLRVAAPPSPRSALDSAALPRMFRNIVEAEGTTETVGFLPRLAARLLDSVLAMLVALGPPVLGGVVETGRGMSPASLPLVVGYLAYLGYFVLAESLGGATIGKLALGLRVLAHDDKPVGVVAAFVRAVAVQVDAGLFGAFAAYAMSTSPRHQRFGDRWARTVVVRARDVPPEARRNATVGAMVGLATTAGFATAATLIAFVVDSVP